MKNLLNKLNNISDYTSLQDFINSCDEDALLNACLLCLPNDFKNVDELKQYIIDTMSCDWEDEDGEYNFRIDLECYFEGCALSFFKSEEEYAKIMKKPNRR